MKAVLSLYSLISRLTCGLKNFLYDREWLKPRRAPLPVISVGNLGLGGTGKTPAAMEILGHLLEKGARPALVSRGYKGIWEKSGGILSDGKTLLGSWREGGDEPYLVALRMPRVGVFVGKDRYASCLRAVERGFNVAVLDDGFQHRRLHRDLDILLHHPSQKTVWRESPASIGRAAVVLVPRNPLEAGEEPFREAAPRARFFGMSIVPTGLLKLTGKDLAQEPLLSPDPFRGTSVLAFCGLASPAGFFETLEKLGMRLSTTLAFRDHHDYPPRSWQRIVELCRRFRPDAVVTTEKDAVKLLGRKDVPGSLPLYALRIRLSLDPAVLDLVTAALSEKRRGAP